MLPQLFDDRQRSLKRNACKTKPENWRFDLIRPFRQNKRRNHCFAASINNEIIVIKRLWKLNFVEAC